MFSAGAPDGVPSLRTEGGRIWRPEFGRWSADSVESAVILVTTPSMRKWTSDVNVYEATVSASTTVDTSVLISQSLAEVTGDETYRKMLGADYDLGEFEN
jgi:hypothetical protein